MFCHRKRLNEASNKYLFTRFIELLKAFEREPKATAKCRPRTELQNAILICHFPFKHPNN